MHTNQPTYDDILRLFQETAFSFQETDRRFKETDLKFQETDRKIEEMSREVKTMSREIKAVGREVKRVNESIGRLGNRLGDFVEEMVRPAAVRLFREQGIDVHEVHRGVEASRGGDDIEIDLLVVNTTDVVAVECKSLLSSDDVNQHVVNLNKLKRMLPTYAEKRVMGAVAAMVLPDNVARYAYRQGLFVIAQSGDHLLIRNDAKFKPHIW
ncbi:MAG: DUF3782 domain-containing protein [Methylobacter sp.]